MPCHPREANFVPHSCPPRRVYKTKEELWAHFLRAGAFEGRNYRFTCELEI